MTNDKSPRRHMRSYQQRRFMVACAAMGFWVVCTLLAGSVLGTGLFLVFLLLGVMARLTFGPLSHSPLHPIVDGLRRRPWRSWDEVLDVAANRLDTPPVIRTTLDGRRVAACLVVVAVDTQTLHSIATTIGLAMAEDELTGQYINVIQVSGASLVYSAPPQVVLRGDDSLPPGAVWVKGDFRAPTAGVSADGPTVDLAASDRFRPVRTLSFDDVPTVQQPASTASLQLVLPDGSVSVPAELGTEVTIGKSPRCTVTLVSGNLAYTSRVHAKITYSEQGWVLSDESTNGTTVNGSQLRGPATLQANDVIVFGTRPDAPGCVVHLQHEATNTRAASN